MIDDGYEVSTDGRVRSIPRALVKKDGKRQVFPGKNRKLTRRKDEYLQVRLKNKSGRIKNYLVHRLVASAFLPNPNDLPEVNHKNNIPHDNRSDNLEWLTTQENVKHAHSNGFVNSARGERHGCAKLTEELVRRVRRWAGEIKKLKGKYTKIASRLARMKIEVTNEAVRAIVNRKTWKHVN